MSIPTDEQLAMIKKLAIELSRAVLELVQAAGDKGVISGELYAALMPHNISINTYTTLIETLKRHNLITESNHVIRATTRLSKAVK